MSISALHNYYFLGPDEKGMPRDWPEFFGPDFGLSFSAPILRPGVADGS